jgi:hypothetical protein
MKSVAFSPRANYTDFTTAAGQRTLVPTFANRGISRDQHDEIRRPSISVFENGAPTAR